MDDAFIRNRISILRMRKNVSEYKMSMDLGHSSSYIHSIASGKALPSMGEFLYICEYLGVTPREFFDEEMTAPQMVQELYRLTEKMQEEDLRVLINTAERLNAR